MGPFQAKPENTSDTRSEAVPLPSVAGSWHLELSGSRMPIQHLRCGHSGVHSGNIFQMLRMYNEGQTWKKAHIAFRQSDKSKLLLLGRTSCRTGCSTVWEGVLVLPGFELLQGYGSWYIIPTSAGLAWKKQLDRGNLCLYARRNRWILNNQTPPNTSNW